MPGLQLLKPYQQTIAQAVLESVLYNRGLTFTVEIAHHGGAREISAHLELFLLSAHALSGARHLKVTPEPSNQAAERLTQLLGSRQTSGLWSQEAHEVRVGRAHQIFLDPTMLDHISSSVGLGPVGLLEVEEAQTISQDTYKRHLAPLTEASGATTVLYGFPWNGSTWFERQREENRQAEGSDALQRHFRVPWQQVAQHNPLYAQYVAQERARYGEEHPCVQSQYDLRPMAFNAPLLSPTLRRSLQGAHLRRSSPQPGKAYIASVRVIRRTPATKLRGDTVLSGFGETLVVTIAEQGPSQSHHSGPTLRVVEHRWWQSRGLARESAPLVHLLRNVWKCQRVVLEVSEEVPELASLLRQTLGATIVETVEKSATVDSQTVLEFLAAAGSDRLNIYAPNGSREHRALWYELDAAQAQYQDDGFVALEMSGPEDGLLRGLLLLFAIKRKDTTKDVRQLASAIA